MCYYALAARTEDRSRSPGSYRAGCVRQHRLARSLPAAGAFRLRVSRQYHSRQLRWAVTQLSMNKNSFHRARALLRASQPTHFLGFALNYRPRPRQIRSRLVRCRIHALDRRKGIDLQICSRRKSASTRPGSNRFLPRTPGTLWTSKQLSLEEKQLAV